MDEEDCLVLDVLRFKHPQPGKLNTTALVTTDLDPLEVHSVLFDSLTGQSIRNAALRTRGSAGPSGVDANGWRRMCTGFHRHCRFMRFHCSSGPKASDAIRGSSLVDRIAGVSINTLGQEARCAANWHL